MSWLCFWKSIVKLKKFCGIKQIKYDEPVKCPKVVSFREKREIYFMLALLNY